MSKHRMVDGRLLQMNKRYGILQDEYQCSCDRRTIYSNVDALIHAGFKIKQVKGNTHGYYMEERIFSLPELKLLVDAVQGIVFLPCCR